MTRKYRQSGYMDTDKAEKPRLVARIRKSEKGEPRMTNRVETKFHLVTRCNNCAAEVQLADVVKVTDRCKNCGTDLHTCRNCLNFDPSARNECTKPVVVRVTSKNINNFCTLFEARVLIEKQGSGAAPAAQKAVDPRHQAFHDLFK